MSKDFSLQNFVKKYPKELLSVLVLLVAYGPTLDWMWDRWFARDSYYSHGIMVPFVTAYLIWQLKDELAKIPRKESKWAFPVMIFGLILHFASIALRVYFSSGFSLLIVVVGLILYFWGEEVLKKISFPIFFLVFMIPVPLVTIRNISFELKMLAAQIATEMLNSTFGIPAIRMGSEIRMLHASVVVDDACSGLRSLIALTALGSIFAYWMEGGLIRRTLVFLSTIPIAILTNVCRVLFLSLVSEIWGPEYATGFIHDASGFLVFALAFIMLYGVSRLLE